jgi:cytochrome c oxidase assembly protein subunit 15
MSQFVADQRSPWPHRWAWLLACATFPLIWWGGFVTVTGSGMAFVDWLMPDGYLMPLYPWFQSSGGKFIEHGHRLLGMLSGLLTIALLVSLYLSEDRRWVRRFGVALLAGVIFQGVLGGLRVNLDERVIALIHGCTGPLFFAACAAMVAVTSPRWTLLQVETSADRGLADSKLLRLAILTSVLAYLQLVIGAVVRHSALMTTDQAGAIFQIAVYFHVLLAFAVLAHVLMLAHKCFWRGVAPATAASLGLLIVAQVLLGLTTWLVKYGMPGWAVAVFGEWSYRNTESGLVQATVIAGHGAVGALIVALCTVAALKVGRQVGLQSSANAAMKPTIAGAVV